MFVKKGGTGFCFCDIPVEEFRQCLFDILFRQRRLRSLGLRPHRPRRNIELPDLTSLHDLDNHGPNELDAFPFLTDLGRERPKVVFGCHPLFYESGQLTDVALFFHCFYYAGLLLDVHSKGPPCR